MGVSVSEMTNDSKMATASVNANSLNRRPITSLINKSGINTATSESVSEISVKPIWAEPFKAASSGDSPSSR